MFHRSRDGRDLRSTSTRVLHPTKHEASLFRNLPQPRQWRGLCVQHPFSMIADAQTSARDQTLFSVMARWASGVSALPKNRKLILAITLYRLVLRLKAPLTESKHPNWASSSNLWSRWKELTAKASRLLTVKPSILAASLRLCSSIPQTLMRRGFPCVARPRRLSVTREIVPPFNKRSLKRKWNYNRWRLHPRQRESHPSQLLTLSRSSPLLMLSWSSRLLMVCRRLQISSEEASMIKLLGLHPKNAGLSYKLHGTDLRRLSKSGGREIFPIILLLWSLSCYFVFLLLFVCYFPSLHQLQSL